MDEAGRTAGLGHRELDVVGVGEISLDRVLAVPRLPGPGDKVAARSEADRPGGQIATALLGCARLGLRCAFVGALGEDPAAEVALAPLRAAGVDLAPVQRIAAGVTRQAVILVEAEGGERAVVERRDPRTRLDVAALDPALIERSRALLIDTTDFEASLWAARVAREAGTTVFLDADDPNQPLDELLPWVDVAIVNQSVALGAGELDAIESGLTALCKRGPEVAVATRGEAGAVSLEGREFMAAPAFAVAAADTTGAGDAFRAGWLAAWLQGAGRETALMWANATAALNCTGTGAQGGLPTASELETFLARQQPR